MSSCLLIVFFFVFVFIYLKFISSLVIISFFLFVCMQQNAGKVLYGFIKLLEPEAQVTKYVLLHWQVSSQFFDFFINF